MDLDKDDLPTFHSFTRDEMVSIENQIFENNWGKNAWECNLFFVQTIVAAAKAPFFSP